MSFGAPPECGFSIARGDPDVLDRAWGLLACTADGVDDQATTIETTATSLARAWNGHAASAYQELSSASSTVYRDAAATLRSASAIVRCYSSELARCREEGMAAAEQAQRCLAEIETQMSLLGDAQRAVSAAQRSLDAARARATSPLGFPASYVHAEVAAAQTDLAQAQAEEQAASEAIAHAREELSYWQAQGRQAWDDAQAAAGQASGGMAELSMTPPPVAATPASPARPAAGAPRGMNAPKKKRRKVVSGHASLHGRNTRHRKGSATMTIDPTAGTIEIVRRTRSGETIDTITYTRSGGMIETITYPRSGAHSGSGVMIVQPGPRATQAPKRPGGATHAGSGVGSGTSTVG